MTLDRRCELRNIATMATAPLKNLLHDRGIKLANVARDLSVDKGTLTKWSQHRVPAERVLDFEKVTGISRHEIRPDLYPRDEAAA